MCARNPEQTSRLTFVKLIFPCVQPPFVGETYKYNFEFYFCGKRCWHNCNSKTFPTTYSSPSHAVMNKPRLKLVLINTTAFFHYHLSGYYRDENTFQTHETTFNNLFLLHSVRSFRKYITEVQWKKPPI